MSLKELKDKYKDVIPYLFFGVCTTAVNVISYWVCVHMLACSTMVGTVIAWLLAVLFAYVTNRKWVFYSEACGIVAIAREMGSFFGCRLATGIVDWGCMYVFVNRLSWNDMFVKFAANVLVIILNYVASKLVIFKRRDK